MTLFERVSELVLKYESSIKDGLCLRVLYDDSAVEDVDVERVIGVLTLYDYLVSHETHHTKGTATITITWPDTPVVDTLTAEL